MFSRKPNYLTVLALLTGVSTNVGAVMVDDFTTPAFDPDASIAAQEIIIDKNSSSQFVSGDAPGAIGSYRSLYLSNPNPSQGDGDYTCLSAGQTAPNCYPTRGDDTGLVVLNSSATANADAVVFWNGSDGLSESNLTNPATTTHWDLTGSDHNLEGFYLDFNYIKADVSLSITVWTDANSVQHTGTSIVQNLTADFDCSAADPNQCTPSYVFFPFASFGGTIDPLVDFASVNAIALNISGSDGYGIEANSLQTTMDPSVPEPATLALAGMGLLGMGWSRRRAVR